MCARMQSLTPSSLPRPWPAIGPSALSGNRTHEWPKAGLQFYFFHLWAPLAIFAALSLLLIVLHGDLWLADRLYAMEGHAWSLQNGYVTQDLLHAAGRQASKDLWFALAMMVAASLLSPHWKQWRRPLLYLLLSTALSTAAVGLLKRWTNMDCPWDLLRYGGDKNYYTLFMHRPSMLGHASCFPAGHASAGYAWIALYFFFLSTRPRWRGWGLGFALALGAVFGVAQQLRGAHFLSHDLWTLMICWLIALALYLLMLGRSRTRLPAQGAP
jgi:membrane-associated PAP2 superfamily phosphatase